MSAKTQVGHVVWHDLMTSDVTKARRFYAELLDWQYQIEQTANSVWQSGAAEYPLILANGEAHGGFVEQDQDIPSHWLAYVVVTDVDMITTQAQQLGATIIRPPFDTPGVGRSSVIQDQQGAIIGSTLPTHTFPAPKGTFIGDELITNDVTAAERFYGELFGWPSPGTDTVSVRQASLGAAGFAAWVPYLATQDVEATLTQAKRLGASEHQTFTDKSKGPPKIVLADPMGALFGLVCPNA